MNIRKKIIIILAAIAALLAMVNFINSSKTSGINPNNVTIITAPEQDEPMEHEAFYAEEYVSSTPDGTNIALDAKITANGFQDVYTPAKAKDGNTKGASYWEGEANSYPNILTAELAELSSIHEIRLKVCPDSVWGKREQEIEIKTSVDGENYTTLFERERYTFDPNTGNEIILSFDEVNALYVQLIITNNTAATGGQIAEFEIYS